MQGLGMTKHEWNNSFDEIAERLRAAGFQTVQFDFPIFVDGQTREMPLSKRAKFVEAIAGKYKPRGVIAQSYGVPTILSARVPSIQSQVFISGSFSPHKNLLAKYQGKLELHRSHAPTTYVDKKFWDDIQNFDDAAVARSIVKPTYIFHGDKDDKISVSDVRFFYDNIPVMKKIKIFIGGDHGINDVPRAMREEFLSDVGAWFKQTL